MRIVVCEAQVPFVEGGAEYHVRELVRQLRLHGHETELVSVPFKWYPKDEILAHAAAWRFLDLSGATAPASTWPSGPSSRRISSATRTRWRG